MVSAAQNFCLVMLPSAALNFVFFKVFALTVCFENSVVGCNG